LQPDVLSPDRLSSLIGHIYEGALEPIPWATILEALRTRLKANWAVVVLRPASTTQPASMIQANERGVSIYSDEFSAYYLYTLDPFAFLPPDRIFTPEEIVGEQQYFGSEFFNQYLKRHDIRFLLGADFRSADGAECRFRVCRPERAGPYSAAERELCQLLLPHFKRAIHLHSRLQRVESERDLLAGSIDRLHIGVVILDEAANVLTTNRVAEEILTRGTGLTIGQRRLQAGSHAEQLDVRIRQAQAQRLAAVPAVSEAMSISRPGRSPLSVLVKPVPMTEPAEGSGHPNVAVFIRDSEQLPAPSIPTLRMLFGFTFAEAALAKLLAEGLSLDEAGARLGISRNTVKSRLGAIFAKTGVKRQSSLVRVLLDAIASM